MAGSETKKYRVSGTVTIWLVAEFEVDDDESIGDLAYEALEEQAFAALGSGAVEGDIEVEEFERIGWVIT